MKFSGWMKLTAVGVVVIEVGWVLATESFLSDLSLGSLPSWPWIALVSDVLMLVMLVLILSIHLIDSKRIRKNVSSFAKGLCHARVFKSPSWPGIILASAFLTSLMLGSFVANRAWALVVQATVLIYLAARAKEYGEKNLDSMKARIFSVNGKTFPTQAIRAFRFKFTSGSTCLLVIEAAATCFAWMERLQYGFFDGGLLVGAAIVGLVVSVPIYLLMLLPYYFARGQ